ncbi:MAG: Fe(3+) ABC transporter substrate-binding protein [Gammaproteobacteria bacterium]|nr:Fe(3+) ABC transporter substrate-binding protein [Gammaproteobacteria bacterium]MCI0591241.1 Fe(3+) ABC transporter substrate-binding protein [Gammaproteobacteria bacterium]
MAFHLSRIPSSLLHGLVLSAVFLVSVPPVTAEEVNVYSARQEALIKPILDQFTAQTGITVNLLTGEADTLLPRLQIEGPNSPADVFLTEDAGRLYRAKAAGVLQGIQSETLEHAIPHTYRDPEGYWYGLSLRARVIVYSKERVRPEDLTTYEALADPKWKPRVCVRSSSNIYNQSLVASLIAHDGAAETEDWARGLVTNFARPPQGGDQDQIKAVAAGQCDVALVNTYYLARMLNAEEEADRDAASKVAVFWPNQAGRGVHVNVSGAGITRSAKHREEAIRLLEFLASDEGQAWYAEHNQEYPVTGTVAPSATLREWGEFVPDTLNLSVLGENNAGAVRLMDRAGWK